MKTRSAMLLALLFASGTRLFAAPPDSMNPDLDYWRMLYKNTGVVLLDPTASIRDAEAVADALAAIGATHIITLDREAVLFVLPPELDGRIPRGRHITRMTRAPISTTDRKILGPHAQAGADFVTAAATGRLLQNLIDAGSAPPIPSTGDAFLPPSATSATSPSAQPGLPRPTWLRATPKTSYDNLTMGPGRIRVVLLMVESNGAVDPNEFSWTPNDVTDVTNLVLQGFQFWIDVSQRYGKTFAVTLTRFEPQYSMNLVGQPYEPIRHNEYEDDLWINPIMANLGYASGDKYQRIRAQNEQFISSGLYTSAFTTFVIYNPTGAPGAFRNNVSSYAYLGMAAHLLSNPFNTRTVVPITTAHEMGHVYWACDEGTNSVRPCDCTRCNAAPPNDRPTDNVPNGNCERGCGYPLADCIMRAISNPYFTGRKICTFTAQHIGWNAVPCFNSIASGHWGAVFYNDTFDGVNWTHFAQRVMQLDMGATGPLNINWGTGSPSTIAGCSVNSDHFSAFFQGYVNFSEGNHTFTATADDGVQVIVDGHTVIDAWRDQAPTTYTGDMVLTGGTHRVAVNYYESTGGAMLQLSWNP
jgi:PA14 domain-containing protein